MVKVTRNLDKVKNTKKVKEIEKLINIKSNKWRQKERKKIR